MSKFRTRPGVVLTNICGEYALVTARALVRDCPFVTQINDSSAYLWEKLREGSDEDGLMAAVEAEFDVDDPVVLRGAIRDFLNQMLELKLLIKEQ